MDHLDKQQILEYARKTLEVEQKAIFDLHSQINDNFANLIQELSRVNGRIIVTGVGKSAIVAQKFVATLNSTGSPAGFLHGADAVHGDLGSVQTDDFVVFLSKSGNTDELKLLLPHLKSVKLPTLLIGADQDSFLAKECDYFIHTPINEEADLHNLAPTASSTAQLAICDAIAISLSRINQLSKEQFIAFHPGGSIGRQLTTKVKDLMQLDPKPGVQPDQSLKEAILLISANRLGAVVVLDDEKRLMGIITDGDIRRILESNQDIRNLKSRDVMTTNPVCVDLNLLAYEALETLRMNSINQLVVTKQNEYCGMIHIHDILRAGIN